MTRNVYKATKEFICLGCKKIISKGMKYVDFSSRSEDALKGVIWTHYRYHEECAKPPVKKQSKKELKPLYERIREKLDEEGSFPMADEKHIKLWICGVFYQEDGAKYVLCREWCSTRVYAETFEKVARFTDADGKHI